MDGVLADTSQLHFETWEQALTEQGIPFDRQKFHLIYGLKNGDLLPILANKPLELNGLTGFQSGKSWPLEKSFLVYCLYQGYWTGCTVSVS